jgi:hypothetical protein
MRLFIVAAFVLAQSASPTLAQTSPSSSATPRCAAGDPVVWVNTSSHVYHLQGTQYYGKTKAGNYQCKSAADAAGNHQAKNEGTTKPGSAATPVPTASAKHPWWMKPTASPSPAAAPVAMPTATPRHRSRKASPSPSPAAT